MGKHPRLIRAMELEQTVEMEDVPSDSLVRSIDERLKAEGFVYMGFLENEITDNFTGELRKILVGIRSGQFSDFRIVPTYLALEKGEISKGKKDAHSLYAKPKK